MDSFPLWAILIIRERCNNLELYGSAFNQIEDLINWLKPIDTCALNLYKPRPLTKLEDSYQLRELALMFNTTPSQLYDYYNDVIKDKLWMHHK
jgi:hypothetical protein